MRFAAIALATGLAGTVFAANIQGTPALSVAEAASRGVSDGIDATETGSIAAPGGAPVQALRLIDLRSGTTCRTQALAPAGDALTDSPLGRDCRSSPSLARIAFWRTAEDGSLIMADSAGDTVLEFVPGDGVLYESVYPSDQLITIVPARG